MICGMFTQKNTPSYGNYLGANTYNNMDDFQKSMLSKICQT